MRVGISTYEQKGLVDTEYKTLFYFLKRGIELEMEGGCLCLIELPKVNNKHKEKPNAKGSIDH